MALIERLCALVPPPRKKLLTYHGVFAPAASARDRVAGIFAAGAIRKILVHLGLPPDAPEVAPARPPPQLRLPW